MDLLLKIRQIGDIVLTTPCRRVYDFGQSMSRLSDGLRIVLEHTSRGAGLAANQMGVSKSVFIYNPRLISTGDGVVINPVIIEGNGKNSYLESCLSIPNFEFWVERYSEIHVKAQNIEGEEKHYDLNGFAATLFQHEIDHLNGLTIFDRIPAEEFIKYSQKELI